MKHQAKNPARVLVVDDDPTLLNLLGSFLESCGYTPVCVPDLRLALEMFNAEAIDSVLTDYRLGRDSGLDLIRDIRERSPSTPIVLMSAHLDEWMEYRVQSMGAVTCLQKPFSRESIFEALEAGLHPPS